LPRPKSLCSRIRNSQFPCDAAVFTPFIDGFLRAQRVDDALALMRELRDTPNIEMVASPYNAFMTHYLARRKYEFFHSTYADMLRENVKPTIVTFTLLVQAAVNQRDDVRAWAIIENDMQRRRRRARHARLCARARHHGAQPRLRRRRRQARPASRAPPRRRRALRLHSRRPLGQQRPRGRARHLRPRAPAHAAPTATTFVYLLKTCLAKGENKRAYELLDDIAKHGVELDTHLLSADRRRPLRQRRAAEAEALLRDRIGEMYVSLLPLVEHFCKLGDVAEAERVLADFQPQVMPTRDMMLPLLCAYCTNTEVRNREMAEQTYAKMARDQYSYETVTEHTYMMQLYTALRERDLAFRFYESGLSVPKHNHAFPPHFLAALICFHDDRMRRMVVEKDLRQRLGPHRTHHVMSW
jgi:pentatricopeptide repeat protein